MALALVVGLAWRVRKRGAALPLTLTAVFCQVAAMIVFLSFVQPANVTTGSWPLDSIPPDWSQWRDQWEYSHAVRAVLQFGALAAQIAAVISETPSGLCATANAAATAESPATPDRRTS